MLHKYSGPIWKVDVFKFTVGVNWVQIVVCLSVALWRADDLFRDSSRPLWPWSQFYISDGQPAGFDLWPGQTNICENGPHWVLGTQYLGWYCGVRSPIDFQARHHCCPVLPFVFFRVSDTLAFSTGRVPDSHQHFVFLTTKSQPKFISWHNPISIISSSSAAHPTNLCVALFNRGINFQLANYIKSISKKHCYKIFIIYHT